MASLLDIGKNLYSNAKKTVNPILQHIANMDLNPRVSGNQSLVGAKNYLVNNRDPFKAAGNWQFKYTSGPQKGQVKPDSSLMSALKYPSKYVSGNYVQPILNVPSGFREMTSPNSSLLQRGMGGLKVMGGILAMIPDPLQDTALPAYQFLKGANIAQNRGAGVKPNMIAAFKSASGETPAGLGDVLSKSPTGQTIGNLAELPLMLAVPGLMAKKKIDVELIKRNGKIIQQAIDLAKFGSREKIVLRVNQIQLVDDVANKFIPDVVNSREMQKIKVNNPNQWYQYVKTFLEDRLVFSQSPDLAYGLSTRELKHAPQPPKGVGEAGANPIMEKVGITPSTEQTLSQGKLKTKVEPIPQKPLISDQKLTQPSIPLTESISQNERGFVTNVKTSPTSTLPLKQGVKGTYTPITNQETMSVTQQQVKNLGWDASKQKLSTEPFSAENNLIGQEMMRQAQQTGRHDEAIAIAETLAKKGTEAGQSVQAFSVWSRMTPEGMVRYAGQQIEQAKRTAPLLNKIFGMKNVKLTPEDSKVITEIMKKANAATTEAEQAAYVKEAFEYVGKKIPWGVSDLLDEFRYNNMLSNPLTHLRNIYSNLIQTFITRPATTAVSGHPLEAAKYEVGAIKSLPEAFNNAWKTMKGNKPLGKMDFVIKEGIRKPPRLGLYGMPSRALEAMDQFFTTLIKGGEKMGGKTDEVAQDIANYSLFRQDLKPNQQGFVLNKIDDVTKAIFQLRRVGLGWFIPFIRTPMNVAKQMVEYSPAGITTIPGAANKSEQLAKMALGSIATAFGAKMALENRTTWNAPTDPKAKDLFYASGKKPFSVKIGNEWVPMQYLGVYAWAVGLPAAYKYYNDESPKALTDDQITKLTKTIASLGYQWSQQTFVSGLASFVSMAQGDMDYNFIRNLAYTVGQLIPYAGMQRYIATAVDPIFRKATTFTDQLKSGIPGLTKQLEPYTLPSGEPEVRNPSNYIAPYGMGIANPEYEQPYKKRVKVLQQNAARNQAKNDITYTTSSDAPTDIVGKAGLYVNAVVADPGSTINAIASGQPIRKIRGSTVILERQNDLGLLDKGDKNTQVDHVIALSLGGTNAKDNLQIISAADNIAKGHVETYLSKLLASGEITKKEAQQRDLNWRNEIANLNTEAQEKIVSDIDELENDTGSSELSIKDGVVVPVKHKTTTDKTTKKVTVKKAKAAKKVTITKAKVSKIKIKKYALKSKKLPKLKLAKSKKLKTLASTAVKGKTYKFSAKAPIKVQKYG